LLLSLRLGEPQVQIIDVDRPGMRAAASSAHPDFSMEHAAALREGNSNIDVPCGPDRKPGEDRIPIVPSAPDFDIGEINPVVKIQQGPQEIHLSVAERSIGPLVDFLEQKAVRMEWSDGPTDAFRTI